MYKVGDEVIEKSTGRKAKIISKAEMAEMCYELKFPDSIYNALRFAREITPANTALQRTCSTCRCGDGLHEDDCPVAAEMVHQSASR